jgi:hypothetical protein
MTAVDVASPWLGQSACEEDLQKYVPSKPFHMELDGLPCHGPYITTEVSSSCSAGCTPVPRLSSLAVSCRIIDHSPQHLQVYLRSGTEVCAHYLASGFSQQARRPPPSGRSSQQTSPAVPPHSPDAGSSGARTSVPGMPGLRRLHCGRVRPSHSEHGRCSVQAATAAAALQHRLTECAVNVAARRWLRRCS